MEHIALSFGTKETELALASEIAFFPAIQETEIGRHPPDVQPTLITKQKRSREKLFLLYLTYNTAPDIERHHSYIFPSF